MEAVVRFPSFVVIVHKRDAHTANPLMWGSLRLAPITQDEYDVFVIT